MKSEPQNCPSCGSEATGIYCPHCGERVRVDKDELCLTFFLREAFEEISDLDSKFIKTIRYLIFKPGFLTLEVLAGRKVNYIKPFRLYILLVVIHFLAFSFFRSGDIFSIDRMPIFKMIPQIHQLIVQDETVSGMTHQVFAETLNQKIKDNLNVVFYFLVFLFAFYMKMMYLDSKKYYIEHLYYLLHLICFGLIRNILLIPFIILDWTAVGFVLAAITQFVYTWISLKNVYQESVPTTSIKVLGIMVGFLLLFIAGLCISVVIGLFQVLS